MVNGALRPHLAIPMYVRTHARTIYIHHPIVRTVAPKYIWFQTHCGASPKRRDWDASSGCMTYIIIIFMCMYIDQRSVWFHNKIVHVIFYKYIHVSTVVTLHRTPTFNNRFHTVGSIVHTFFPFCSSVSFVLRFPTCRPIGSGNDGVKNECAFLI